MNKALLSKWLWRFNHEKDAFWRKGVASKFGSTNFDRETKAPKGAAGCGVWKGIYKQLNTYKANCILQVGDGTSVLFWEDHWAGAASFSTSFPLVYAIASTKNWTVKNCAARLEQGGAWNLGLDRRLTEQQIAEVCALTSILEGFILG